MEKKLPIAIPLVKTYKWHAVPLTVYAGNASDNTWIFENYLQLVVQDYPINPHWLDFYTLYDLHNIPRFPWLYTQNIDPNLFETLKIDLTDFIISCIDNSYYLDACYDMYYAYHSFAYQKEHRVSNMLIYGYNMEKQTFHVVDYLYTTKKRFQPFEVDEKELSISILSENNYRGIKCLYKYNIEFDLCSENMAHRLLSDYRNGTNSVSFIEFTQKKYKNSYSNLAFGINVYPFFEEYINMTIDLPGSINVLPFATLWEHKCCLLGLVKSHESLKGFTDEVTNIKNMAEIVKYKSARYSMSHDLKNLFEIREDINRLSEMEMKVLERMDL